MENLWRSCAKVRDPIELSFGVVNRVCIGVWDGVHMRREEGEVLVDFLSIGLKGVSECIFKTELYSTRAWKIHNISVRTIYQRDRYLFFFLKMYYCYDIEIGIYEKTAKM